jgi:hypothetical protein
VTDTFDTDNLIIRAPVARFFFHLIVDRSNISREEKRATEP